MLFHLFPGVRIVRILPEPDVVISDSAGSFPPQDDVPSDDIRGTPDV